MSLHLDWCSYEAAKYAVEHWHYSRCMPKSKLVKIGAWEDDRFIGTIIFGSGANSGLGNSYGLTQFETCELVRVALTNHKFAVSKIVSIAIMILRKEYPKLRLIVSFADPEHGHIGGIYQAMNWIYIGMTEPADEFIVNGKRWHGCALRSSFEGRGIVGGTTLERAMRFDPDAKKIKGSSKYRYLYPLDNDMRKQVEPLRKPYPKRGRGEIDNAPQSNEETGGASPTRPLLMTVGTEKDTRG